MELTLIGIVGFIVLFVLIFAVGMPIGFAMALIGFIGIATISGFGAGIGSLGTVPYTTVAAYTFAVIPLFILMGEFTFASGIIRDAYSAISKWTARLPGGMAIAT